ncbi:hypothetical protein PXK18_18350 [Phaeobacter gallaeciensis]|nr:hypothetical protein [Phaeobacter gallaeciensis]
MKNFILLFVSVFLFTACASIVEGDQQSVSVETPDCPKAKCVLSNEQGSYYISSTPSSVIVNKSRSPLSVKCSKNDYDELISIESGTEGVAFGNILAGGIIGAAVDMSTGAAYVYPPTIQNPLDCG